MKTVDLPINLPRFAEPMLHPYRYKVLYGGRGAGRSWTVARILLTLGASKTLRVLCARELQRSIQDSVHKLLVDQIKALQIPGYEITQREIRHVQTGTVFLFEGLRYNITKIKSMEGIDICWVEEAERVSKESWQVLIPTIRKAGSEIWITFNPDLEDDPTYARFVKHPPPRSFVQKVSWADNPWFPEELREEKDYLYRVDPEAAEHVWGGETRSASDAQIFRGKWKVEHFDEPKIEHTGSTGKFRHAENGWQGPYQGLDFGFAQDPTALIRCWIEPPKKKAKGAKFLGNGRLFISKQAYKIGLDTDKMPQFFRQKVPNYRLWATRADSARPETISYLKKHGMPQIRPVIKWNGSIEDGIAYLRSFEEIIIHPDCPNVKDEFRLYSYKVDDRTGDILPDILDKHNNTIDAIRYALAPLIRMRRLPMVGYGGGTYVNQT
jgi:phage terminase large subunit